MSRRSFLAQSAKMLALSGWGMQLPACRSLAQPIAPLAKCHAIDQLHQILIMDGFGLPQQLSKIVQARTQQFKQTYPSAHYTLWTGEMLRDFIGTHFDATVLSAFDTLKPYSYKSDLARYCLLYAFGGLYSDLSVVHFRPWQIRKRFAIAAFLEIPVDDLVPHTISTSLLWAQPFHPTMKLAIETIVRHCHTHYYGRDAIDPTGPGVLGGAWAHTHVDRWKNGGIPDYMLGEAKLHWKKEIGVELTFFPNGIGKGAVAQRPRRHAGDSRRLGLKGSNNYREMWHRRDVYL